MARLAPLCGLLCLVMICACSKTTVVKNPDDFDKGIRYYRPKPYLLIQPAEKVSDEFVSLSLAYLPDFSEEYSIHVRSGLGINDTKISLQDGWNLTHIDQKLDAQFDESLGAVSDLIGKLPIPTVGKGDEGAETRIVVRATNVPLGFYESIISRGPDGRKHLYGWRYVGFHPFVACPTESSGAACVTCDPASIYALVFERGVMTFKPIGQVEPGADLRRELIGTQAIENLPPVEDAAGPALEKVRRQALARVRKTKWGAQFSLEQIAARILSDRVVLVSVHLAREQLDLVASRYPNAVADLQAKLLPDVRGALLDSDYQARVEFVP